MGYEGISLAMNFTERGTKRYKLADDVERLDAVIDAALNNALGATHVLKTERVAEPGQPEPRGTTAEIGRKPNEAKDG